MMKALCLQMNPSQRKKRLICLTIIRMNTSQRKKEMIYLRIYWVILRQIKRELNHMRITRRILSLRINHNLNQKLSVSDNKIFLKREVAVNINKYYEKFSIHSNRGNL